MADDTNIHAPNETPESGWATPEDATAATQPSSEPDANSDQKNLSRPSAQDIYEQVAKNAKEELKRSSVSLAISGLMGGVLMGLSALGVALILATLGTGPRAFVISRMFYPLGFIVVILGRSQLFTENTLYPVALVLTEPRQLWNTMRLWATVLPANIIGALAFAALAGLTQSMPPAVVRAIASLGVDAVNHPSSAVFWSGVVAGWIIATAAWLVSGSHSITGSVMVIWALTFVVGLGNFAHCIASSGEILTAVLTHQLPWIAYPRWLLPAVGGNIAGGVIMVTLLEYGQAVLSRPDNREENAA
ncbi:MAG: formate/nitrite transporter family protein [Acidobacteria bacterium]|nr:formate/nitrite transporter family protein [Acidobacteriota bacterium]